MDKNTFQDWSALTQGIQKPIHELIALNIKTLQEFTDTKIVDVTAIQKPEQLLKQQVELILANGKKAIDYMEQSFKILENALSSLSNEFNESNKKAASSVKEAFSQPLEQMAKSARNSTESAVKAAKSVLESTEAFDPLNPVKEMTKTAFDHSLASLKPQEQMLKATQSAAGEVKGFEHNAQKKQKVKKTGDKK